MSEETTIVTEPKDDATVVQDQPASEEQIRDDLVEKVTKVVEKPDESTELSEKPGDAPKGEKPEEPPKGEGEKEEPSLSKELQSRATGAGLSEDLAQTLHQSGQLEETLAAFDRGLIEHFQSKEEPKDEAKESPKETPKEEPPPKDLSAKADEVPALDPDVYDEDLVKRDTYQQQRIDALEKQLEAFQGQFQELIDGQSDGFDEWFDGTLAELGVDVKDEEKCQAIFRAYGAMCEAFGKNSHSHDKEIAKRAHTAMYPQDVFKEKQRQTVERLRDASGKFISSPISKGGPPPKDATEEEINDHLVSNVTTYLKEQGVQMSGI